MPSESDHVWAASDAPPSSTEVRRAGDRIRKAREVGGEARADDIIVLDRFRAWHQPILYVVQQRLADALRRAGITSPVVGRPLKTHDAIIAKLLREKSRLSRMQDIAGTRVVVPDLDAQESALRATLDEFAACEPRVTDTRLEGDANGYRGLHVIVRLAGRYAEIQLRTPQQAIWAQLVETFDEAAGTDLKHGDGPDDVRAWLKQFSGRLGRVERGEEPLEIDLAMETLLATIVGTLGQWAKRRPSLE